MAEQRFEPGSSRVRTTGRALVLGQAKGPPGPASCISQGSTRGLRGPTRCLRLVVFFPPGHPNSSWPLPCAFGKSLSSSAQSRVPAVASESALGGGEQGRLRGFP